MAYAHYGAFPIRPRAVRMSDILKNFVVTKVAPIISITVFLSGIAWTIQHGFSALHLKNYHVPIHSVLRPVPSIPPDIFSAPPSPPWMNNTKIALLIENRPLTVLAPLVLHFITILPPEWSIRFVGTSESIDTLTHSTAIKHHILTKKLITRHLPHKTNISSQELISRFMTTLWLWDDVLSPAENVLIFQTDSILCSRAHKKIDNFLEYDWIGAPWRNKNRLGGNGGLSLRKRGPILEILKKEKRKNDDDFEDVWFTKRLKKNKRKIAERTFALEWSGESQLPDDLLDGFEQALAKGKKDPRTKFEPMGYHIGNSGDQFHTNIWGTKELREHVYSYCPEIKMLLPMDAEEYVPGECKSSWEWGKDPKVDHPDRFQNRWKRDIVPW